MVTFKISGHNRLIFIHGLRTALVRLKAGLEEDLDVEFPYDIPKKINGGHGSHDRSESPVAALE